jgi:hypothetical protein
MEYKTNPSVATRLGGGGAGLAAGGESPKEPQADAGDAVRGHGSKCSFGSHISRKIFRPGIKRNKRMTLARVDRADAGLAVSNSRGRL